MKFCLRIGMVFCIFGAFECSAAEADHHPPFRNSIYSLHVDPDRPRNYFFPPLASFLLPGFDQYWEEQWAAAATYSTVAIGGAVYSASTAHFNDHRHSLIGAQIYNAAGGFSAYHSFRTAVRSQQPHGKFQFLTKEETPLDLSLAPFRFDYLIRPTTILPIATASVLAFAVFPRMGHGNHLKFGRLTGSDAYFIGVPSYLAGTWEEAGFRGYLFPAFTQASGNKYLANLGQATLFAFAHGYHWYELWPRALFGLYSGFLTQYRDWTISESIFIHTWWDAILILGAYATNNFDKKNGFVIPLSGFEIAW